MDLHWVLSLIIVYRTVQSIKLGTPVIIMLLQNHMNGNIIICPYLILSPELICITTGQNSPILSKNLRQNISAIPLQLTSTKCYMTFAIGGKKFIHAFKIYATIND